MKMLFLKLLYVFYNRNAISEENEAANFSEKSFSKVLFDSADNYERESYISLLTAEVRRHFIEEKNIQDEFTDSDNVIKFINATVGRVARELSIN